MVWPKRRLIRDGLAEAQTQPARDCTILETSIHRAASLFIWQGLLRAPPQLRCKLKKGYTTSARCKLSVCLRIPVVVATKE